LSDFKISIFFENYIKHNYFLCQNSCVASKLPIISPIFRQNVSKIITLTPDVNLKKAFFSVFPFYWRPLLTFSAQVGRGQTFLSNFIAKQWRVATRAFSAQTLNV
jgi:hypothetical protein